MLRNSFVKPMLVLSVLVLAALACYSDSPVWPNELTQPPPSPTFLPTPGTDSTALFKVGDTVIAPRSKQTVPQPFLYVADHPEPVNSTLTNSSGNCVFDDELEVLYAGHKSETEIYYLVTCRGSVGWTKQDNLEGPIEIRTGQNALTLPIDANGNPITTGMFGIHNSQPPVFGPATVQCQVGEDVGVIAISVPESGKIWYQVRCSGGIGWVEGIRLFGPLVLPGHGGIGLVSPEVESITLTSAPGGGDVVSECPGDSIAITEGLELVEETAYYLLSCNGEEGWTTQEALNALPFLPNTLLLIEVPQLDEEPAEGEGAAEDTEAPVDEGGEEGDEEVVLTAPITENPGNPSDDNPTVGQCENFTIAPILDASIRNEQFFYQVTCGENTGWLSEFYALITADFQSDDIVAITEAGVVGTGNEAAFYLSEVPQTVAGARGTIGACELGTQATINNYTPLEQADILRVYYQITCRNRDTGEDLVGWALQSRLRPAEAVSGSDSATPSEIFGG
ncbi:MAG: hypothetical protein L0154_03815 [Chloroflexi bacterium]|nr:hypothetical protein [Chloroflexota bacterium]